MDNVHGKIALTELQYEIINTSVFKRLKGVQQLGCVHEVFPSAEHSRFSHSLGTLHVARKWCQALGVEATTRELVEVAALCHDLGHGPLSHLWEGFVKEARPGCGWQHEESSYRMLELAMEERPGIRIQEQDLLFIRELICGGDKTKIKAGLYPYTETEGRNRKHFYLYEIVSNKITGIDVDKFDYLARDDRALFHKSQIRFDYLRLSDSEQLLKVVEGPLYKDMEDGPLVRRIAVRDKEVRSIHKIFQDRSELHRTAYQHKTVLVFDRMYVDVLLLASPYIRVLGRETKEFSLAEACDDEVALSRLTDDWVLQSVRNSVAEELGPARDLLRRIDQRKIYTTVAHLRIVDDGSLNLATAEHSAQILKDRMKRISEKDLVVISLDINMGSRDKSNPVEKMLFYRKGSEEGYFMGQEELRTNVSLQTYDRQLFVLSRLELDDSEDGRRKEEDLEQAAKAGVAEVLKDCPEWTL